MIARTWRGHTTPGDAGRYVAHFEGSVVPELSAIPGFLGTKLLRRDAADTVEFFAVTLWESMDAIARFAGTDLERAVVEPAAQSVLTDYDAQVVHYEVVTDLAVGGDHPI